MLGLNPLVVNTGFESWLERDHVMALDFDPAVVVIEFQPFWPRWFDEAGDRVPHAPDFFGCRARVWLSTAGRWSDARWETKFDSTAGTREGKHNEVNQID